MHQGTKTPVALPAPAQPLARVALEGTQDNDGILVKIMILAVMDSCILVLRISMVRCFADEELKQQANEKEPPPTASLTL